MKSAGNDCSNSCWPCSGYPRCANGIAPESNQVSSTSGTRDISPPHFSQVSFTWSMYGRCRSASAGSPSSSVELTTRVSWQPSQTQNGSGVPQYRVREKAQSTLFSSQSPIRPVFMCGGTQLVALLLATSWSFITVVRMYQESSA